ncbi:non-ribosomal peptide synthetase [Nevskia soli]|uniref:non-ribosomal peptide synthetase n=1 Tax=Nevskia soli TaxID=418856 RepID=UPI00069005A7|nr:non-ribosomal peptide synthetase [Nevskia soli]
MKREAAARGARPQARTQHAALPGKKAAGAARAHSSLTQLFRQQAERFHDKTLFRYLGGGEGDGQCLSYGELDDRARALAAHLQHRGAIGERVLLLHPPGLDYVIALVACLFAGAVAVPAYSPRHGRGFGHLQRIAEDAQARFACGRAPSAMQALAQPWLSDLQWIADTALERTDAERWKSVPQDRSSLALLQYTSGSTGAPRGVCLTHGNFLDNIQALCQRAAIDSEDRIVSWLPPYHDMGLVSGILLPLSQAAEATLLSPAEFLPRPWRWLSAVSRYSATVSGAPNFAYEACVRRISAAQRSELDLRAWRIAFCGAERVRPDTLERFAAVFGAAGFRGRAFKPCYGLAESTVGVTSTADADAPASVDVDEPALARGRAEDPRQGTRSCRLSSCGAPLDGLELLIVDPSSGTPLGEDAVGEIWIRGASVGTGYWRRPEATQQAFGASVSGSGGWLRSGDLGFLRRGELFVTGRLRDLIVLRGVNHYPEDLEATMERCHPRLRPAGGAAFAIDDGNEERLVIVHEVDSVRDLPLDEISAAIRHALAELHQLQAGRIVLLAPGAVPRTTSGKVQRHACRELFATGRLAALEAAPRPRQEPAADAALVAELQSLMAGMLDMPQMAASDDFFWLGGHSLLATQLASRIAERFGVDLPLRAVFETPTPQGLARQVAAAKATATLPPLRRVDRGGELRLSYSQERMWLMHRFEPQGAAYNVAAAVLLEGELDPCALRQAFSEVLAVHEVLRTRYPAVDGTPRMRVVPQERLQLPCLDLSGQSDPRAAALAGASAMTCKPFDIESELLLRAALFRTGPREHLLALCLHHLVTDGWSMGLLAHDLLRFYETFARGETPERRAAEFSFIDYAQWQRSALADDALAPQLAYWTKRLEGAQPLELRTDRPRTPQRTSAGAFEPLEIEPELMDAVERLASAHGTTTFMVLLAAFELLLHRHSGASDLVVAVPVANRNRLSAEPLMGCLVNTLALRLTLQSDWSFARLLAEVRSAALEAYEHQDLPFERLTSKLQLERRPGESPLVRVMFDFQNAPMPLPRAAGLRVRPVPMARGAAQFDLSLLMLDTELGRSAGIEYSTELFDAATIQRFARQFRTILEAVTADARQALDAVAMIGAVEREGLLALGRPSRRAAAPQPLTHAIADLAASRPGAPAVEGTSGVITYARLWQEALALAERLQAMGARPGERVAVCMERKPELVCALLAVLLTGAAYVPIDPGYPAERIEWVARDAAPCAALTDRQSRGRLPPGIPQLCIDEADASVQGSSWHPVPADGRRPAYVIYTSGSTGHPKGVEVSCGALWNFLGSMRREPGIASGDRLLSVTTIAFDISGLELWLPLSAGATVYVAPAAVAADGAALLGLMQRWRPTLMQATPATWRLLLEHGWIGDAWLRILCGGEAMSPELSRLLLARCAEVWNMYGPTETTIWSALHRVQPGEATVVPVGRPIDATRIYVLDGRRQPVPSGVTGEIYIGGAGVAEGYFRRPDLTAERFLPDPFEPGGRMYRTGDAGCLRSDGSFECLGRLDHQIKLRGFRIEPAEIESALRSHPAVRDAVVMLREDRPAEPCLAAYVVTQSPDLRLDELRSAVRQRLPAYMAPAVYVPLERFPTTPNGKIDRNSLPPPAAAQRVAATGSGRPADAVEKALAALWQELLELPSVGTRDNFFDLGGHSLLAAQLFARIDAQFGTALPLSVLIESPTIECLAAAVRSRRRATGPEVVAEVPAGAAVQPRMQFSHLVPISTDGELPPLFCVHGAGGNVLNFVNVARRIGQSRPLWGLQARGVDGRTHPYAPVAQIARDYVAEVQRLQPVGPYHLCGYCAGGIIAFEMAQQLRAAGHQVESPILIDCAAPGAAAPDPVRNRGQGPGGTMERFALRFAGKLRRESVRAWCWAHIGFSRLLRWPVPPRMREFWVTAALLRSITAYSPGVYPGRLIVLRAADADPSGTDQDPALGWSALARDGVETAAMPGNHLTLMEEPHVTALAITLARCMDTAHLAKAG